MDDHVRLGRQYPIAVFQHQFKMMDIAILISGSRHTKYCLMSNVSAENAPKRYAQVLHMLSNVGDAFRFSRER